MNFSSSELKMSSSDTLKRKEDTHTHIQVDGLTDTERQRDDISHSILAAVVFRLALGKN